jgi:hypothetical protein
MIKKLLLLIIIVFAAAEASALYAQSLALSPAEFQHRFKPGQPFQFEIGVSNSSDKPMVMRANVTDLWYNEKNEKLFTAPGSSPRSAANWMEVVPPQITVPAGGSEKVRVIVTPPMQASGGYYATVFLESRPELAVSATAEHKAVFANIRLGSLILLSAEGSEEYSSEISDAQLTPPSANHPLKLDFLLANKSNSHIFPETRLAIFSSKRELAAKAEGEVRRFFPQQQDRLSVSWSGTLRAGAYTAVLTVAYGPDKIETREFSFTVDEALVSR